MQALPFADERFDAVACAFGVIHVPDPAKALAEFRRVLKSGGRVAVSTWEAPKPSNGFGLLYGAIKAHGKLDVGLPHGPDFFQFSDEQRLAAALKETGFREVEVRHGEQVWKFDEPSGILTAVTEGAVRARGLLEAQTGGALRAISEAVKSGMTRFETTEGSYLVPMPALIGAATK